MMAADNKGAFIVARVIVFLSAFPFVFLALLYAFLGYKNATNKEWLPYIWLVAISLLLFFISLFPKSASHILFWRASEEKKALYIRRVEIIVSLLVAYPLIFFLYQLLWRSSSRTCRTIVILLEPNQRNARDRRFWTPPFMCKLQPDNRMVLTNRPVQSSRS